MAEPVAGPASLPGFPRPLPLGTAYTLPVGGRADTPPPPPPQVHRFRTPVVDGGTMDVAAKPGRIIRRQAAAQAPTWFGAGHAFGGLRLLLVC